MESKEVKSDRNVTTCAGNGGELLSVRYTCWAIKIIFRLTVTQIYLLRALLISHPRCFNWYSPRVFPSWRALTLQNKALFKINIAFPQEAWVSAEFCVTYTTYLPALCSLKLAQWTFLSVGISYKNLLINYLFCLNQTNDLLCISPSILLSHGVLVVCQSRTIISYNHLTVKRAREVRNSIVGYYHIGL